MAQLAGLWLGFLLLTIIVMVIFGLYVWYRNIVENTKNIKYKYEMLEYNYNNLYKCYNDSREIFHDFSTHITIISQLAKEDNINTKLLEYIKEIQGPITNLEKIIWSGNKTIDLILNYKYLEASSKGIVVNFTVPENNFYDLVKDKDICIVLNNLLDNAIEACYKIKKFSKYINLSIQAINSMLFLSVENSIEDRPECDEWKFLSSKPEKYLHGMGLESVKKVVNKYNGIIKFEFDENKFIVYITFC